MSENEKAVNEEAKGRRSPRFPVIAIDEAIERASRIYKKDKRALTPFEAVIEHMGYTAKGKGGRAGRAVAALKQYGLLDERVGRFRISELAFQILERSEDNPERTQLVKEAAFRPTILRKVFSHFDGEPPSDTALKDYLVFDEGFNPDGAKDFIRVIRRTKELVNPTPEDYTSGEESERAETPPTGVTPMQQPPPPKMPLGTPPPAVQRSFLSGHDAANAALNVGVQGQGGSTLAEGESVLAFRISRGSEARVIFTGQVTQEAIEKLRVLLDHSKDTYPTQAELEKPRRAIWHNKDHDQPVTVTGEAGEQDGRRYMKIEGSEAGVPEDELEYQ